MKRLSFTLMIATLAGLLGFVACNTEEVDPNVPNISVSGATLEPGNIVNLPQEGGSVDLLVESNRPWQVTNRTPAQEWLVATPTYGENNGTVRFTCPSNMSTRQQATWRISTPTEFVDILFIQQGAIASETILSTNFGTGAPDSGTFPTVAEWAASGTDPWKLQGVGKSGVTITGTSATVRANQPSSTYAGASGSNNILIPAAGSGNLLINNIQTLGITGFQLSFGFNWTAATGDASTDPAGKVEYSTDGVTWTAITATFPTAAWGLVTCAFDIPSGSTSVSLRFTARASQFGARFDDVTLIGLGTPVIPDVEVTTGTASSITKSTATISNNTYSLNAQVTIAELGVAYAESGSSTWNYVAAPSATITPFSVTLGSATALTPATVYQYKAYAKVGEEYTFGGTSSFTTLDNYIPPTPVTTFSDDFQSIETASVAYVNADKGWRFESTDADVANGWKTGIYNTTEKYLQCAPYASSQTTVTAFAVMPPFDVNGAADKKIGYSVAYYYQSGATDDGTKLELVATENYEGSAAVATWTLVKDLTVAFGSTTSQWIAGEADLTSTGYATKTDVVFAFRYTGKAITYRLDNVTFNTTIVQTVTFGTPYFKLASLAQNTPTPAESKIVIPYSGAVGGESYNATVALSGSLTGLSVAATALNIAAAGDGTLEIPVTGTPTATGKVTFTISGVTTLSPNTASTYVIPIVGGTSYVSQDFSSITTGNAPYGGSSNPTITLATVLPGWSSTGTVYAANGAAKLGTASTLGNLTTPALAVASTMNVTMNFKMGVWSGDPKSVTLTVNNGGTINGATDYVVDDLLDFMMTDRSVVITGATAATTVTFKGTASDGKNRFYLDDVYVFDGQSVSPIQPSAVTVADPTGVTDSQASVSATYTAGNQPVTAAGFEYSTDGGTTWPGTQASTVTASPFTAELSGLTAGTPYTVRAYVQTGSSGGKIYSASPYKTFTTLTVQPITFGTLSTTGTFKVGTSSTDGKILIAYTHSTGTETYPAVTITCTDTAFGTAGSYTTSAQATTVGAGNIQISLPAWTPAVAGQTTFTVTGITGLDSPDNTAKANVLDASGNTVLASILFKNETISGAAGAFSNFDATSFPSGASFTKFGGTATQQQISGASNRSIYAGNFQVADAYWVFAIPAAAEVKGNIEFKFGSYGTAKASANWSMAYSNDGTTWNPCGSTADFTITTTTGDRFTKTFTIAEANKVPAGGTLYIKVAPTTILPSVDGAATAEAQVTGNFRFASIGTDANVTVVQKAN